MAQPKILILSGYGLNCEEETALAFSLAGGYAQIIHINDLISEKHKLMKYQILAVPGGFSYGDDTGSGKAYANKLKNHLKNQLYQFAEKDKLIIGICNGFQILTNFGLLPGALTFNDFPRYTARWVDVKITPTGVIARPVPSKARELDKAISSKNRFPRPSDALRARNDKKNTSTMTKKISPWLAGINRLSLPIAHGEGKFYAEPKTLAIIRKQRQIGAKYYAGEISKAQNLQPNPNGSLLDIAMVTSPDGKILGTMPHPERAVFFTQHPHWTVLKEKLMRAGKPVPKFGPALQIFKNAVNYYK